MRGEGAFAREAHENRFNSLSGSVDISDWLRGSRGKQVVVQGKETVNQRNQEIVYLTNRFYVAVCLFSNRSQMTSKCRKNKEVAHEPQENVSLLFLPHFDVFCDLLLNRPTATWNLFVLYNDQKRKRPIHIPAPNSLTF